MSFWLRAVARIGCRASSTYEARQRGKIGCYARREQDWAFQSNLAAGEITQIFKQLRAAQIREAIAEQELKNHRQQMKHAEEIEHFLNEEGTEKTGKKTNKALYAWMKREVKGLYAQCFQFAFDIAKKAERALAARAGQPGAELSPVRLPGRQGGPARRREALPRHQAHGDGLPRAQPARVRADQARQPAPGGPAGAAATARHRPLHGHAAGGAVRHGRPRPLLPAHQDGGASASRA